MSKFIIAFTIAALLTILTGCNTSEPPPSKDTSTKTNTDEKKDSDETTRSERLNKEVGEKFAGEFTVKQKANLAGQEVSKQSTPIRVSINNVYTVVADTKITNNIRENEYLCAIYINVKNTSDDSVAFDISSGRIPNSENLLIMNTGEEIEQVNLTDYIGTHFFKKREVDVLLWFPLSESNNLEQIKLSINAPYGIQGTYEDGDVLPKSLLESLGETDKLDNDIEFQIDF